VTPLIPPKKRRKPPHNSHTSSGEKKKRKWVCGKEMRGCRQNDFIFHLQRKKRGNQRDNGEGWQSARGEGERVGEEEKDHKSFPPPLIRKMKAGSGTEKGTVDKGKKKEAATFDNRSTAASPD